MFIQLKSKKRGVLTKKTDKKIKKALKKGGGNKNNNIFATKLNIKWQN